MAAEALDFDPLGGEAGRRERERIADFYDDTARWTKNGRRLSDRLWRARQYDRAQIDAILKLGIARGEDPLIVAEQLEAFLTPAGRRTTTTTPRAASGREDATGNYAARRLARTEVSRAFAQATLQAAARNPFVRGVKWLLSARHPRADLCDPNAERDLYGLGVGTYPAREFPPIPAHPQCLCVASPQAAEDTDAVVASLRQQFGLDREPGAAVPFGRREDGGLVSELFRIARAFRETPGGEGAG